MKKQKVIAKNDDQVLVDKLREERKRGLYHVYSEQYHKRLMRRLWKKHIKTEVCPFYYVVSGMQRRLNGEI